MKKETVNIFNKGLNYDLNPMTTPPDVLTDCVNGTFVTFNGDELILQNDAGNTKILKPKESPNDPDEYITLSPGFQPIGIKERGGILYIVSAKSPLLSARMWDENESYNVGEIVVNKEIYYLVTSPIIGGNMTDALFMTESEYFLMMENESLIQLNSSLEDLQILGPISVASSKLKEKLKELNITLTEEIEFGSYPSPQVYTENSVTSISPNINIEKFFTPITLNEKLFTAGTCIVFPGEWNDFHKYLSSYRILDGRLTKITRLFNLRFLQQLENGIIDLTEDIWYKYLLQFPPSSGDEYANWINTSGAFTYYCPNNYKGKGSLVLDMEYLESFKINSTKIVDTPNDRVFNISVFVKPYSLSWNIKKVILYTKDSNSPVRFNNGGEPILGSFVNYKELDIIGDNLYSASNLSILSNSWGSPDVDTLYYEVHVVLQYFTGSNYETVLESELVQYPEFRSSLIQSGSVLKGTGLRDINIKLFEVDLNCYFLLDTGYRAYDKIYIVDLAGNYINPWTGNVSTEGYYLRHESASVLPTLYECGDFIIGSNNKVESVQYISTILNQSALTNILQNTIVRYASTSCSGVDLTLQFDGLTDNGVVKINQIGEQEKVLLMNSSIVTSVYGGAASMISTTIPWGLKNEFSIPALSVPQTFKVANILNFKVITKKIDGTRYADYLVCDRPIETAITGSLSINGGQSMPITFSSLPWENLNWLLRTTNNLGITKYNLSISGISPLSNEYINLVNSESNYRKINSSDSILPNVSSYIQSQSSLNIEFWFIPNNESTTIDDITLGLSTLGEIVNFINNAVGTNVCTYSGSDLIFNGSLVRDLTAEYDRTPLNIITDSSKVIITKSAYELISNAMIPENNLELITE